MQQINKHFGAQYRYKGSFKRFLTDWVATASLANGPSLEDLLDIFSLAIKNAN